MGPVHSDKPKKRYLFGGLGAAVLAGSAALFLYEGDQPEPVEPVAQNAPEVSVAVQAPPASAAVIKQEVPENAGRGSMNPQTCYLLRQSEILFKESQDTGADPVQRYKAFVNSRRLEDILDEDVRSLRQTFEQNRSLLSSYALGAIQALDKKISMSEQSPLTKFFLTKELLGAFNSYASDRYPNSADLLTANSDYLIQMTGWSREKIDTQMETLHGAMMPEVVNLIKSFSVAGGPDPHSAAGLMAIKVGEALRWDYELTENPDKKEDELARLRGSGVENPEEEISNRQQIYLYQLEKSNLTREEAKHFFESIKAIKDARRDALEKKTQALSVTPC